MKNAAFVIFVTKTTGEDFQKKYSFLRNKTHILYWGYNEEDFENVRQATVPKNYKLLVHAGNIFDYQNPSKLWVRIKEVNRKEELRIKFIGTVSPAIKREIEQNNLPDKTEYAGFLPYKEMLNQLLNADYLLVCASEKRHLPGKLFEYLRTGKPILAFGDENEEVKEILQKTGSGMIFRYNEDPKEFFDKADSIKSNLELVKQFDRKRIAENLGMILNQL